MLRLCCLWKTVALWEFVRSINGKSIFILNQRKRNETKESTAVCESVFVHIVCPPQTPDNDGDNQSSSAPPFLHTVELRTTRTLSSSSNWSKCTSTTSSDKNKIDDVTVQEMRKEDCVQKFAFTRNGLKFIRLTSISRQFEEKRILFFHFVCVNDSPWKQTIWQTVCSRREKRTTYR